MSQRVFSLPIRALSSARSLRPRWICRRCLATQPETHNETTPVPPAGLPEHNVSIHGQYDPSLPASQRGIRLNKTDFNLKKPLKQKIPTNYLQHSTSDLLHDNEKKVRARTVAHKRMVGVVVSAGKMQKTVKVRIAGQKWNKKIGKNYDDHTDHLTHDPNDSLVEGDVVELHRLRVSKTVQYVVGSIVSPFGRPLDERPPVPTADDRLAAYKAQRFAKLRRRELRAKAADGDAEAIAELERMGLDPGAGVEPGVGKKGAVLGGKGQKLLSGVLPGGEHEVGKINARAQHNKGQAEKFDELAEERLLEAKEKAEELESNNLTSDSALR